MKIKNSRGKSWFALAVALPVVLPIITIDHVGEILINVSQNLSKKIGEPYCRFWSDVFGAINRIEDGRFDEG